MPEIIWKYAQNTFDSSTRNSHVKMLSIATDTESKLQAEISDPDILALHTAYFPAYDAYRLICINYDVQAGNREGQTLNVETLVREDLPKEVRKWEAQVRIIYVEDSPQERAIFPNKRNPFVEGTYEDRISAVGSLAARLAADANATLVAYAPTVLSYYNLLLSARDTQQMAEGALNALSATREAQRLVTATELYAVLGGLMRKYKTEPPQIMRFFDMSLLRDTGGDEETILATVQQMIPPSGIFDAGALPPGTQKIRMTGIVNGVLEFGMSNDGLTFIGNTTALSAPASATYTLADFGALGSHFIMRNQNNVSGSEGKIEFLG